MPEKALKPLATVDGWPINLANQIQSIDAIIRAAREGRPFSVVTLNLDHLVKLRRDPRFRHAYTVAHMVTADGAPVAWLAGRQHASIERTTGADLVVPLSQAAAAARLPVYLFGTAPDVLARAGRDLAERSDFTLDIAGSASPAHGFDPAGPDADAALERIRDSGARLCFVALGAPKQEIFAARAVEKGIPCGFVCIGAALDFLAGTQIRAPKAMQKSGLEWLWRLATNPGRLAGRYARCAIVLADLLVRTPFQGHIPTHRS